MAAGRPPRKRRSQSKECGSGRGSLSSSLLGISPVGSVSSVLTLESARPLSDLIAPPSGEFCGFALRRRLTRGWHRTHEQFRYQLVGLLDRVLDLLESDPDFAYFTLDGQVVVLDDYADCAMLDYLWRVVLENHPHDSICGCSIDAVHEQMETRFARVRESADAHLSRMQRELGSRVRAGSPAHFDLHSHRSHWWGASKTAQGGSPATIR